MKTLLKSDSQIQRFTIALFLLSFILIIFFNEDIISKLIIIEFFLILLFNARIIKLSFILKNILEPIQSLLISYSDKNLNNEKLNT